MQQLPNKLPPLVPHPRFGAAIVPSNNDIPYDVVRKSCFRYQRQTIFPETAIRADTSRQNYSVVPLEYYVDILKECRNCKRQFIFFALEQKYWYEELRFWIDADCVRCPKCRKQKRTHPRRESTMRGERGQTSSE